MKVTRENLTQIPIGVKVQWIVERSPAGAFQRTGEDEWKYCSTGETKTTTELLSHLERYGGTIRESK